MKQAQNARQQRGRPSSRQGGKSNRGPGNHRNEQKSRGNPKQLVDKYQNQARECLQAGDRMQAEYFFQFAEHYYRVLNENRNNSTNQGDRDNQNNNRRQNAKDGDNSGNDGPQGGRHNRRGRRARPQDDRNNTANGENQPEVAKQNGADGKDEKLSDQSNGVPQQDAKPDNTAEKPIEKPAAADATAPSIDAKGPSTPTAEEKANGSEVVSDGDAPKPVVKRRAPRKRVTAEDKPASGVALDPVVSDLT